MAAAAAVAVLFLCLLCMSTLRYGVGTADATAVDPRVLPTTCLVLVLSFFLLLSCVFFLPFLHSVTLRFFFPVE